FCGPVHIVTKLLFGRSPWPQWFLGGAGWIIGARVRLIGAPIKRHSLLIVNHTSWLDILIMGGATNCAFVSKDELGHGLLHWLADQLDVARGRELCVEGRRDQASRHRLWGSRSRHRLVERARQRQRLARPWPSRCLARDCQPAGPARARR